MENKFSIDKNLEDYAGRLYRNSGPNKPMGENPLGNDHPFFSTFRIFLGTNDIVTLFKTKRCQDQCAFCTLPSRSPQVLVSTEDILKQFSYVLDLNRESLHATERFTLSNEGSMLNADTFPRDALYSIINAIAQLGSVQSVVLETSLEYVDRSVIEDLKGLNPRVRFTVLHGLETINPDIRKHILGKDESFKTIAKGLDILAQTGVDYIPYILYKPSPHITDDEADHEAKESIKWIVDECRKRGINLSSIRLNPMYGAIGSKWWRIAKESLDYRPPSISRVMRITEATFKEFGIPVWIGLETEGRADDEMSYKGREDWKEHGKRLYKQIAIWNKGKTHHFELPEIV